MRTAGNTPYKFPMRTVRNTVYNYLVDTFTVLGFHIYTETLYVKDTMKLHM